MRLVILYLLLLAACGGQEHVNCKSICATEWETSAWCDCGCDHAIPREPRQIFVYCFEH